MTEGVQSFAVCSRMVWLIVCRSGSKCSMGSRTVAGGSKGSVLVRSMQRHGSISS